MTDQQSRQATWTRTNHAARCRVIEAWVCLLEGDPLLDKHFILDVESMYDKVYGCRSHGGAETLAGAARAGQAWRARQTGQIHAASSAWQPLNKACWAELHSSHHLAV